MATISTTVEASNALEYPLAEAARREVLALHAVFEGWLGGMLPPSDEAFGRIEAALAPTFSMVSPEGEILARTPLLAGLRGAHGAKGRQGPFRIAVEDMVVLHLEPPLVVLRYGERQSQGEARTIRHSTAVFRAAPTAPCGVEWIALQETWAPRSV
jgi:hypothetical protein